MEVFQDQIMYIHMHSFVHLVHVCAVQCVCVCCICKGQCEQCVIFTPLCAAQGQGLIYVCVPLALPSGLHVGVQQVPVE